MTNASKLLKTVLKRQHLRSKIRMLAARIRKLEARFTKKMDWKSTVREVPVLLSRHCDAQCPVVTREQETRTNAQEKSIEILEDEACSQAQTPYEHCNFEAKTV